MENSYAPTARIPSNLTNRSLSTVIVRNVLRVLQVEVEGLKYRSILNDSEYSAEVHTYASSFENSSKIRSNTGKYRVQGKIQGTRYKSTVDQGREVTK